MFEISIRNCSESPLRDPVLITDTKIAINYSEIINIVGSQKEIHYTTIEERCRPMGDNCPCSREFIAGLEVESENGEQKYISARCFRN